MSIHSQQYWSILTLHFKRLYSTNLKNIRFTKEHEWAKRIDDINPKLLQIGITDVAQKALGDIVYIELPEPGIQVSRSDSVGIVESVKGASDIFSPVTGKIIHTNEAIKNKPSIINKDPFIQGWIYVIEASKMNEFEELMDEASYKEYCRTKKSNK